MRARVFAIPPYWVYIVKHDNGGLLLSGTRMAWRDALDEVCEYMWEQHEARALHPEHEHKHAC